jgi:hypothetical protein
VIIHVEGGESELDALTEYSGTVTLPVLQDTSEADVETAYNAEKWFFYLGEPDGTLRYVHYQLDLDSERDRLLAEIDELRGEK